MSRKDSISVKEAFIIPPMLNEEQAIGRIIDETPKEDMEMKVYRDEIPVFIIMAARVEQIQGRCSNTFT